MHFFFLYFYFQNIQQHIILVIIDYRLGSSWNVWSCKWTIQSEIKPPCSSSSCSSSSDRFGERYQHDLVIEGDPQSSLWEVSRKNFFLSTERHHVWVQKETLFRSQTRGSCSLSALSWTVKCGAAAVSWSTGKYFVIVLSLHQNPIGRMLYEGTLEINLQSFTDTTSQLLKRALSSEVFWCLRWINKFELKQVSQCLICLDIRLYF